jgi:membrane fusion protein (multidrug efflux system)
LLATVRDRPLLVATILIVLSAVVVGAVAWWLYARQFETTDDAFIDARTVPISAQVNGPIVDVPITDNRLVGEGAVLVRIDDRDYRAQVAQANAQVEQAKASIANLDAQIDAQQARIDEAERQVMEAQAALTFAEQENRRAQELAARGAGTEQRAQKAASDLKQRQAAFAATQATTIAAQKQIAVLRSQRQIALADLQKARAALEQAEVTLSRTILTAPTEGRLTKISAAKGAYAQVGQALTMFVPREVWVTANFKETQLTYVQPGQAVRIDVDAYPNRHFSGHVDSIQPGSGTAFSLLPAENATGNYVKVVQRVPVKIVFDQAPDVLLGPGMSVVPRVKVQ